MRIYVYKFKVVFMCNLLLEGQKQLFTALTIIIIYV